MTGKDGDQGSTANKLVGTLKAQYPSWPGVCLSPQSSSIASPIVRAATMHLDSPRLPVNMNVRCGSYQEIWHQPRHFCQYSSASPVSLALCLGYPCRQS